MEKMIPIFYKKAFGDKQLKPIFKGLDLKNMV